MEPNQILILIGGIGMKLEKTWKQIMDMLDSASEIATVERSILSNGSAIIFGDIAIFHPNKLGKR